MNAQLSATTAAVATANAPANSKKVGTILSSGISDNANNEPARIANAFAKVIICLAVLPFLYDPISFAVSPKTDLACPKLPIFSNNSLKGLRNLSRIDEPPSNILRSFQITRIIPVFNREEPSRPLEISLSISENTLTTAPRGAEILVMKSASPRENSPNIPINDLIRAVLLEKSRFANMLRTLSVTVLNILGSELKFLCMFLQTSDIVLSSSFTSILNLSLRNLPKDAILDSANSLAFAVPSRPLRNKSKFRSSLIDLPKLLTISLAVLIIPLIMPNSFKFILILLPSVSVATTALVSIRSASSDVEYPPL